MICFLLNQQQILPVVKFRNDYTNINSKYLEIVIVSKLPDFITSGIEAANVIADRTVAQLHELRDLRTARVARTQRFDGRHNILLAQAAHETLRSCREREP